MKQSVVISEEQKTKEEQIIKDNQGLILSIIHKLKVVNRSDYDDLIQEGNIALLKASRNFDASRGLQFSTYAYRPVYWTILGYLQKKCQYRKQSQLHENIPDTNSYTFDFLDGLDERAKEIVYRHMVLNESQVNIKENLGITDRSFRKIKEASINKLIKNYSDYEVVDA